VRGSCHPPRSAPCRTHIGLRRAAMPLAA
jgi:hypothetical protein